MAFTPTTALPGTAQTGFTSPVYNLAADVSPFPNAKQWYVSTIGGTQSGVLAHTVASPFTISVFKPIVAKVMRALNAMGIATGKVPKNVYKVITRKGVLPLAGQPYEVMVITTTFEVPAGADIADQNNVRAGCSAHFGVLLDQSANMGNNVLQNVI